MAFEDCMAEVERAAGRKLSDTEREAIAEQVDTIVKRARLDDVADLTAAVQKRLDDFARDTVIAAQVARRNTALNKLATTKMLDYVTSVWGDNYGKGLKAYLGGVASARRGARDSVAAEQQSTVTNYAQSFLAKLHIDGVHSFFTSGVLDKEIWRAVEQLGKDTPDMRGIPVEAQKIARIIEEHSEHARLEANRHGANIGKLPGYVMKQTHDMYKIKAAGSDEWVKFVGDKLDLDRTFPDFSPEKRLEALRGIYTDFASGTHIKFGPPPTGGFTGSNNIGKRLSHDRTLHFKDADAGFEYNQKFGSGTLAEGVTYGLEKLASDTVLMRRMGPNAEANLDEVILKISQRLRAANDVKALDKFVKGASGLKKRLWPNLNGESRIPHNTLGAKISSNVRKILQMAKLGGALLSAPTDIAFYAAEVRYQGGNMLSGMAEAIAGLARGRYSPVTKEVIADLGVAMDSMKGSIMGRFDAEDMVPGAITKMQQVFFKLNGLQWWTDSLRTSFALASSHRLARAAGGAFDTLDPELQRAMGLYGIDGPKWEVVRQATTKEADGRTYLTPEGVRELGDDVYAAYLKGQGIEPTPGRIANERDNLAASFRSYYADRAGFAVLEPDAVTRSYLYGGSQPGTVGGEFLRHFMMFKSFSAAVIQRPLSREIYGRGEQTELMKALKNGNGEILGLANLLAWSTVFGYGAMSLKDLAKGKTPRDVTEDPVAVITAAMLQGGALGIYGDFLFGEMKSRHGGGPLDTLMGPTFATANQIFDLIAQGKEGELEAGDVLKVAINNTPYANLFYTKAALDYGFMYQISESMSPGYLRRMERRAKEEKGQTYLFPPSQAIPYGGGNRLFEGFR
jgi:hypothetical protein